MSISVLTNRLELKVLTKTSTIGAIQWKIPEKHPNHSRPAVDFSVSVVQLKCILSSVQFKKVGSEMRPSCIHLILIWFGFHVRNSMYVFEYRFVRSIAPFYGKVMSWTYLVCRGMLNKSKYLYQFSNESFRTVYSTTDWHSWDFIVRSLSKKVFYLETSKENREPN